MYMREDGIAVVDTIDKIIFSEKEVAEIIETLGILTDGKKVPVLSLFKPENTADKQARNYMVSEMASLYSLADGMVIHNLPQKIIANFYLKMNKPSKPTRFFSDEEEALKWLKTFL